MMIVEYPSLFFSVLMPPVHVGKRSPPGSARHSTPAGMDAVSYEDLLVAQYLEGLKKERSAGQRKR